MKPQITPPDEQNICLKCQYGIVKGYKIQPKGYNYDYTECECWLWLRNSKNAGHRRTCNKFVAKENK